MASFVRVVRDGSGPPLLHDGAGPLRFALANAYYLQEEAARGHVELLDETFAKLARIGVRVVRTWGFNDDPRKADSAIRRGPERLEETGLRGLDRVLARAAAHGLRLILPLSDYWSSYGGARQWCAWAELPGAREGDPRFFTDPLVRERFRTHVAALLDRENPETGLRYGDDPVVLAWELMNEPRAAGPEEDALVAWMREMATVVRAHARQLIATGEEGHEPTFSRTLALGEVDLASVHFYPEKYGVAPGDEAEAGLTWMRERALAAHAAGKPLYVGELGLGNERAPFARFALSERRAIYRRWFAEAVALGIAGIGPWLFAYDARPDAWDDFTWYCRDGLSLDAPENRYADLVAELAARLR